LQIIPRKEKDESLGAVIIGVDSKAAIPCAASAIAKESAAHPGAGIGLVLSLAMRLSKITAVS